MADEVVAGSDELATLYPVSRPITIEGRTVQIGPPTLRRLAAFDQLTAALWALGDDAKTPDEVLFEEQPEAAADMLAAVVDADRDWLLALPPLRKVELFNAWMEFNLDFLSDRLRQLSHLNSLKAAMYGVGPRASRSSPNTESPTPPPSLPRAHTSSSKPSSASNGANAAAA